MPRQFTGVLRNPTEAASTLRVTVLVSPHTVDIESGGTSLGRWRCADVEASRHDGNWFKLVIDDEDWRFLPDAPTEFLFFGVPQIAGAAAPRRPRIFSLRMAVPGLESMGWIALGAALAVLLISIGMLVGRYRLDDSRLAVAVVLLAGAALGGWWTAISRTRPSQPNEPTNAKRPLVLPSDRRHSALSVQDAIAEMGVDLTEGSGERLSIDLTDNTSGPDVPIRTQVGPDEAAERADPVDIPIQAGVGNERPPPEERSPAEAPAALRTVTSDPGRLEVVSESDLQHEMTPEIRTNLAAVGDPSSPAEPAEKGESREAEADDTASSARVATRVHRAVSLDELLDLTEDVEGSIDLAEGAPGGADDAVPVDLTAVRGIGPALSAGLGRIGVRDVHHLAALDSRDQAYLSLRLGRFASSDRIREWVEEAQRLIAGDESRRRS